MPLNPGGLSTVCSDSAGFINLCLLPVDFVLVLSGVFQQFALQVTDLIDFCVNA